MFTRVYVEITNICNMRCSFCHGHSRPKGRMSRDAFSLVLDRLTGHTQTVYYHLMGEPLLHPELPEFMEMARARGFKSILTTNGTLLKKRREEMLRAHPHKISVSLHSFEEGTLEDQRQYLADVASFAEKAAEAGIIMVFRLWNRGGDEGKNADTLAMLRQMLPGEWSETNRGLKIRHKLFLEWGDRFQWPDREAEDGGPAVYCYGLKDHFGILCDGTVVPCCLDSDGVIRLGNIFEETVPEILAKERTQAMIEGFRNRNTPEDLCRRCGFARKF